MTLKVKKVGHRSFIYKLITNHRFQVPSLFFLAQRLQNWMHRIVGNHRQQSIHLCCLWKSLIWGYVSSQYVTQSVDSDMPCCLPTTICCLRRQDSFLERRQGKHTFGFIPANEGCIPTIHLKEFSNLERLCCSAVMHSVFKCSHNFCLLSATLSWAHSFLS